MSDAKQQKPGSPARPAAARKFQPPKGLRDFYPEEMLRRRYIIESWRRVALRHGFDEIDGPTFEDSDLYKVKSGEGILNEMFGVFSGKDPEDRQAAGEGNPPYALRPEFTPTLARMYAARAAQLSKPTKWFCVPNFFRAERPQRGRLREFYQWNCDVMGETSLSVEAEMFSLLVDAFDTMGLTSSDLQIRFANRQIIENSLKAERVPPDRWDECFRILDAWQKVGTEETNRRLKAIGIDDESPLSRILAAPAIGERSSTVRADVSFYFDELFPFIDSLIDTGWILYDPSIVRGLAYYTGTVFEVIAEGERAVAGGGRYDNLIELFGGPPTPAVGFGMGDVVLMNLLEDKGLMPSGRELVEALSEPLPTRCDVFVVAAPRDDEAEQKTIDDQITPLLAQLRRGRRAEEGNIRSPWAVRPLHARRSYKSTRNVGKLLKDAVGPSGGFARFAAIIESPEFATIKNLDTGEQIEKPVPLDSLPEFLNNLL